MASCWIGIGLFVFWKLSYVRLGWGCKIEAIDQILADGRYGTTGIEENFVWAMEDCGDDSAHGRTWGCGCLYVWGVCSLQQPRFSFPTGRPSNYCQPTVLAHSASVFDCSIFDSVSSRAHSYCRKNTYVFLVHHALVGPFLVVVERFGRWLPWLVRHCYCIASWKWCWMTRSSRALFVLVLQFIVQWGWLLETSWGLGCTLKDIYSGIAMAIIRITSLIRALSDLLG